MTSAVPQPELLTVAETARRLRVSEKTVRRLVDRSGLPALKVGAQIRVDEAELQGWLYGDPGYSSFRPVDPAERGETSQSGEAVDLAVAAGPEGTQ